MTPCSLLRLFLLRIPYLATLGTYQRRTTDEVPKQLNQRRTLKKSWIHCFQNASSVAIICYIFYIFERVLK